MSNAQTSGIYVSWDETAQCVICEGVGFNKEEKVKAGLNSVLELLKQKKATRMLTDMKQVAPFGKEIENWIEQEWLPQMIAAGLKRQAFVMPQSAVTRMILDKTVQNTPSSGREMAFFDSQEAAKEWLRTH
jgi:hypothetical protein